jgi:hypothetical protein
MTEAVRTHETAAPRAAQWHVAIAVAMVGVGGALLGLQVDADGKFSGTGLTSLAIGTLLALVSSLAQARATRGLPRDGTGAFAAVAAFLGLTFVVAGSLAPGGPWMFFEVFLLFVLVAARRRGATEPARWIGGPTFVALDVDASPTGNGNARRSSDVSTSAPRSWPTPPWCAARSPRRDGSPRRLRPRRSSETSGRLELGASLSSIRHASPSPRARANSSRD